MILVEAHVKNYFNVNLEKSHGKKVREERYVQGIIFGNSNLRPTEDSEVVLATHGEE